MLVSSFSRIEWVISNANASSASISGSEIISFSTKDLVRLCSSRVLNVPLNNVVGNFSELAASSPEMVADKTNTRN